MRRPLRIGILAILVVLLAAGGSALYLRHWYTAPGPAAEPVTVELPPGTGVRGIARRLAAAGAIDSAYGFELAARLGGRDRTLRAGEYRLPAAASPRAILDQLASGEVLLHPVTLAEGLTVREVFEQLASNGLLSGDLPEPPAEGTLLPETYHVPRGETRARFVERMRRAMDAALAEVWARRAPDLPVASPQEALVLASIIERETALPEEHGVVAAVFVNRLRRGMRLQTDPTVIYGLADGRGSLGRPLSRADLGNAHAYNTYVHAGLPPGPIANPGRAALLAAVQPAEVDYLYFVADGTGGHAFARTLEEHQRNVARWRRLERAGPAGQGNGSRAVP